MLSKQQQAEVDKYCGVYRLDNYAMGAARKACAVENLKSVAPTSYLDVGCGRGEMIAASKELGFDVSAGAEVVDYLTGGDVVNAPAWDLPFKDGAFDVVSIFDVIEHLLPGDDEKACRELDRVAAKHVFITAANYSSCSLGVELHVNKRAYADWDQLFKEWFSGRVEWLPRAHGTNSETWHICK